ncbi:MAG: hypothetical protein F6K35_06160, partial [Okeania sp. SIO2H7]|nr:hypothetical protein [Okeania sp. SIO2H7]
RKSNAQIFATTHSWECVARPGKDSGSDVALAERQRIEAAHQAFSKSEVYDFRYYRLEPDKQQNNIKVLTYNRDTIKTSIEMQLEMR